VLGSEAGAETVYRNEGTRTEPRWVRAERGIGVELPPLSAPVFADLDGDGRLDLLSGNLSGGLMFWRGR
jgi:hypothetical protein